MFGTPFFGRAPFLAALVFLSFAVVVPSAAQAMGMVGIARIGPQWRVDALFTDETNTTLIGCQAVDKDAPGIGAWSIIETPDGRLHISGGYEASPPDTERGVIRYQLFNAQGVMLGSFDAAGALGAGRFALIVEPSLGFRQMLRDAARLSIAGVGPAIVLELSQMRQLEAVLRTCVRHYADPARQHQPGSEDDIAVLRNKMEPLLGSQHTLVTSQDGTAPDQLTSLKAGDWSVEPWQNTKTGEMVGCSASRQSADGLQWSFVTTPDLFGMLLIERPGIGTPLNARPDKRVEIEFRGIRQGGKFFQRTETAGIRNPSVITRGTVGKEYVEAGYMFDSFTQSSFLNAETFRVMAGGDRYEMEPGDQKLAFFGIFRCLRESFTPRGAVWPATPSVEEMKVFAGRLLNTDSDDVRAGGRLASIEPAMTFQWEDVVGHLAVFDPAYSPSPAERIAKAQTDYLDNCYKKRRNQDMDWTLPAGIDAAKGVQMECDVKGFVEMKTEIVVTAGRMGAHLVIEGYAVHSAARDVGSRFRRTAQRARDVMTDFVLHRTQAGAGQPAPPPPMAQPQPAAQPQRQPVAQPVHRQSTPPPQTQDPRDPVPETSLESLEGLSVWDDE